MQYGIAFTPLVPSLVLWIALAAIAVIAVLLLLGRARGAAVRVAALALILLALANPSFTREDREPLSSVAAVVIDKSPSQNFGTRNQETAKAQEALVDTLKKIKGLEVRVVEAGQADGETDGTKLFGALSSALSASRRRCTRSSPVARTSATAVSRFRPRRGSASSDSPRPSPTGSTTRASAASAPGSWCDATAK